MNTNKEGDAYAQAHKTELLDTDLVFGIKKPRSGCKHCHGCGRKAWDVNGNPILCHCMSRDGGEYITWGEFKYISSTTLQQVQGDRYELVEYNEVCTEDVVAGETAETDNKETSIEDTSSQSGGMDSSGQ